MNADPTLAPMLKAMGTWSVRVVVFVAARSEVDVEFAQRKDVDAAIGELKKLVADEPRVLTGTTLAPVVSVAAQ
jgi:hypothetical protein